MSLEWTIDPPPGRRPLAGLRAFDRGWVVREASVPRECLRLCSVIGAGACAAGSWVSCCRLVSGVVAFGRRRGCLTGEHHRQVRRTSVRMCVTVVALCGRGGTCCVCSSMRVMPGFRELLQQLAVP